MLIALRKSIILYLVILQSLAPLVHAHTDALTLDYGLHVPGLELFMPDRPLDNLQATQIQHHHHGLLVGIDAGIRVDFSLLDEEDSADAVIIELKNPHQPIRFLTFPVNFSPQSFISSSFYHDTRQPRAPPALTLL